MMFTQIHPLLVVRVLCNDNTIVPSERKHTDDAISLTL